MLNLRILILLILSLSKDEGRGSHVVGLRRALLRRQGRPGEMDAQPDHQAER